jgi:hypothetical protein
MHDWKEYSQRPKVKETHKLCERERRKRPEVKEYHRKYLKEYNKEYNQRPEVKARMKEYNREYKKRTEVKARRRAERIMNNEKRSLRVPAWADLNLITKFYQNCPEGMVVDHIIPLQGRTVSGLHVLSNLQYLTLEENLKKSNRYPYKGVANV